MPAKATNDCPVDCTTDAFEPTEGVAGYAGMLESSPAFDWLALAYTLTLAGVMVVSGVLTITRRLWTYWLATTLTGLNFLQTFAVALAVSAIRSFGAGFC